MNAHSTSLSRLILPALLALGLLLIQQVSASHAVQHALAHQQQQEQSAPQAPHHCDLCALDAQLGGTLHSTAPVLLLAALTFFLPLSSASAWHACIPACNRARGPPLAG